MKTAARKIDATQEFQATAEQPDKTLRARIQLLETVIDNFPGGLLVFDRDLKLVLCNEQQKRLLDYPDMLFMNGSPSLKEMFQFNARRGEYGPGDVDELVEERMDLVAKRRTHVFERRRPNGTILEIRGVPLPDGGFVSTYLDVTEQRKHQDLVAHLAHHDQLTGLPNRALLVERLNAALADTQSGRMAAIHYIDLDQFKPVNDTHGHSAGDLVLKTVASKISASVRESDTVARMGGDEFVLVQTDIESPEDAEAAAKRIISTVSETHSVNEADISINASIGIVLLPLDGDNADELLRKADRAMYRSKSEGGGSFSFHSRPPRLAGSGVDLHPSESGNPWLQDLN